jgi:hypothetical protein
MTLNSELGLTHTHEQTRAVPWQSLDTLSATEKGRLKEKIASNQHKIVIAIHPFYDETERLREQKEDVDTYAIFRIKYIERASQAGWSVIIFEDHKVLANDPTRNALYGKLLQNDSVFVVPTLEAHPAPMTPELFIAEKVYQLIFTRYNDIQNWSVSDWEDFHALQKAAGLPKTIINLVNNKATYWQVLNVRNDFLKAFEILTEKSWEKMSTTLQDLSVKSIKMGGSRYESFDLVSGKSAGCLAYAANSLHTRNFRIHLSTYFSSPVKPSQEVKQFLRK